MQSNLSDTIIVELLETAKTKCETPGMISTGHQLYTVATCHILKNMKNEPITCAQPLTPPSFIGGGTVDGKGAFSSAAAAAGKATLAGSSAVNAALVSFSQSLSMVIYVEGKEFFQVKAKSIRRENKD